MTTTRTKKGNRIFVELKPFKVPSLKEQRARIEENRKNEIAATIAMQKRLAAQGF